MHKSTIFTLLLIGSFVMLLLIPSVNTTNVFSNAMAQEYEDYYGDSYHSTYQTDYKKYECQKGPFKGFFVTSVEFL